MCVCRAHARTYIFFPPFFFFLAVRVISPVTNALYTCTVRVCVCVRESIDPPFFRGGVVVVGGWGYKKEEDATDVQRERRWWSNPYTPFFFFFLFTRKERERERDRDYPWLRITYLAEGKKKKKIVVDDSASLLRKCVGVYIFLIVWLSFSFLFSFLIFDFFKKNKTKKF
jgi:hypothetical protein